MDESADANRVLFEQLPENWRRLPGRPRSTWIRNITDLFLTWGCLKQGTQPRIERFGGCLPSMTLRTRSRCTLPLLEMMGWQWHQLDHMQVICTSLQTDNHASTSSLKFLQTGCPSCRPTNSVKALTEYSSSSRHGHKIIYQDMLPQSGNTQRLQSCGMAGNTM